MTRLFATELNMVSAHGSGDITIADGGDFGGDVGFFGPVQ